MRLIVLQLFFIASFSNCLVQKQFEKKFINPETITSALQISSKPVDKLTCSSLCLKDDGEDCDAFKVDKDGCWKIGSTQTLKEMGQNCITASTPTIWSASQINPSYPPEPEYALLATGWGYKSTEIIDLTCPTWQCKAEANLPHIPFDRHTNFAVAGVIGDIVLFCGGEWSGGQDYYAKCFKLEDKAWKDHANLELGRSISGTGNVIINGKLLVSGGNLGTTPTKLTELVSPDGTIEKVQDLPTGKYAHCIIKINDSVILITGGMGGSSRKHTTIYQNIDQGGATPTGPKLLTKRSGHGCGMISIKSKDVAFVAGGEDDNGPLKTTEYLVLGDEIPAWKSGPVLSVEVQFARLIPSRNKLSLFSIGGTDGTTIEKLVCQDTPQSCQWEEIGTQLKFARRGHVVVSIPATLAMQLCN